MASPKLGPAVVVLCFIPPQAWDCVGDVAIVTAADILERMCEHTPVAVMQRMVDAGCDVAIIGRHQASCSASHLAKWCCNRPVSCTFTGMAEGW